MAGRKTLAITDRQYRILQLLWQHGPMTVRELMGLLPRGERQPYTTVLGMLQNMEKSGLLSHQKEGLAHRYQPQVSQAEATGQLLRDFLARFFGGSAEALVAGLVDAEALSPSDLRDLEAKLASAAAGPGSKKQKGRRTRKKKRTRNRGPTR
jgi:predicted transcriptional regulator